MATRLEAVRPIELSEIREARKRIEKTSVRTPLVCLELGPKFPDIRLKLENLQPINAYKFRGAANAVAMLPESERKRGVWTISSGNAGQGVAYAARRAGGAPWSLPSRRRNRRSTGCVRSAQSPCQCRTMSHGKRLRNVRFPEPEGHLYTRLTITISSPAMGQWGLRF